MQISELKLRKIIQEELSIISTRGKRALNKAINQTRIENTNSIKKKEDEENGD